MQQILLQIITAFLVHSNVILNLAKTYYTGDPCITKTQQGICKTWLDCPYIKALIKLGEYTVEEVVHCGFEGTGSNGEIICCPLNNSHFKNPPDVHDRPAVVETSTTTTKLWSDMLTTSTTPDSLDILKTTTNTQTSFMYAAENVTMHPSSVDDKQCLNCKLALDATTYMKNFTDDNNVDIQHEEKDRVRDTFKTNEKQQLQELINNVFRINISKEIKSTTEMSNLHLFNETKVKSAVIEENQNFVDVINLGTNNFQFDPSQMPKFTKQFNPIPQQSERLSPVLQQQQFIHNTQLLDQYSIQQAINQYHVAPPMQPSSQQIQNFQFQFPPPSQQLLNELIRLLHYNIRQLHTLSREFGQIDATPQQIRTVLNVGQRISQEELERYTRLLLQLQEQQKSNISNSLNQIPQSYKYDDLKMTLLQQITQNQFQNPQTVWPQQFLKQQPLIGHEIPTNNLMLNQMNFNPQKHLNSQTSFIAPIPNNTLSQMQFHRQPPQKMINGTIPVDLKTITTTDGTFNSKVAPHIQHLQMPIEQYKLQEQLYNKKNPLSYSITMSKVEHDLLKDHNDIFNFTTIRKDDDGNLSATLNYSQRDNIWNVIKEDSQSQSRKSRKAAKRILLPHIGNFDDSATKSQIIERFTSTTARTRPTNEMRPAVQACKVLESGLFKYITPHILGGIPSEWGEFPHMAAIGYSRIGEDGPPYDIRCGGTLISSHFILTAAHCVSRRNDRPKIVRLGVVNFNDPEQMKFLVELKIKRQIIHENYSLGSSYNDIALLELENKVTFTQYIYPSCLYTNINDPLQTDILYVTGWGVVNLTTRAYSDILLKAPLKITPLEECDKQLREYGLPRQLERGVLKSLLCAWDKNQEKDACKGDSGGPLNLQVDESTRNYRVVGIVISGFECASSTPGLYIRVAEYLDFIEKHVWPNEQYDNEIVEQFMNELSGQSK